MKYRNIWELNHNLNSNRMDRRKFIAKAGVAATGTFLISSQTIPDLKSKEEERALELFRADYHCAQAILLAYSETLNFDEGLATSISSGFGGGMGRLQKTCGLVTGSFMVLGIYNHAKYSNTRERNSNTYSMVREFHEKFRSIHGATDCLSLMNCDLNTEEGRNYAKENRLSEKVCEKCLSDSVRILKDLMER